MGKFSKRRKYKKKAQIFFRSHLVYLLILSLKGFSFFFSFFFFFLFLAQATICSAEQNHFSNFGKGA